MARAYFWYVIGIDQGLRARWEKSTFGISLDLITKAWHQEVIGIRKDIGQMAGGPGKLRGIIKPNGDHV